MTYITKIKKLLPLPRISALVALLFLVFLSMTQSLFAQTAFTQGFNTDEKLQRGMIVRLKEDDATKVAALSYDDIEKMHGVVVGANDAPLTLSTANQQVFVATGGKYEILISDQNGPIEAGSYLTISALTGIGMNAGPRESQVIGRALDGFNGKEGSIGTAQVKDSGGNIKNVNLGRVSATIEVSRNPNFGYERPPIPEALARAAEAVAGKPVPISRIYLALAVFTVTTLVAGTLMYGGVRSGIISIGRNPLSKKSIIKSIIQVIIFGLIIFILGVFGVYLLLKL